jgi:hypothetical protein
MTFKEKHPGEVDPKITGLVKIVIGLTLVIFCSCSKITECKTWKYEQICVSKHNAIQCHQPQYSFTTVCDNSIHDGMIDTVSNDDTHFEIRIYSK